MGKFDGVLIASDIDGTLLNTKGEVSPRNLEAIGYFMDNGGLFTVSTGRSLQTFSNLAGILPINAPAIHANGALLYDHAAQRVIYERKTPEEIAALILDVAAVFPGICAEIYPIDRRTYAYHLNEVSVEHFKKIKLTCVPIASLDEITPDWTKIFVTAKRAELDQAKEYMLKKYPMFRYVYSDYEYLEVIPADIDKGKGVLRLAELFGIGQAHIYTVGDYENDVELLAVAAVAFAPGNAVPVIRERADILLPDNDHDAIAAMIGYIDARYA